jgi:hypothetical protein
LVFVVALPFAIPKISLIISVLVLYFMSFSFHAAMCQDVK